MIVVGGSGFGVNWCRVDVMFNDFVCVYARMLCVNIFAGLNSLRKGVMTASWRARRRLRDVKPFILF
jgi:hypothetical protein